MTERIPTVQEAALEYDEDWLYLDLMGLCKYRGTGRRGIERIVVRYGEDLVVPYDVVELMKLLRELLRPAEDMTRINIGKRMLDGGDEV